MKASLTTTKVTKDTLKNAKIISAHTDEKQYEAIDRAVRERAESLGLVAPPKKTTTKNAKKKPRNIE